MKKVILLITLLSVVLLTAAGWMAYRHPKSEGPIPAWVTRSYTEYEDYGHWICPAGYHTKEDWMTLPFQTPEVYCELDETRRERTEQYERDLKPVPAPK